MTDNPQKCEYCGTPLTAGAEFCDACGQQVRKPAAEPTLFQPPVSPPTTISPKLEIPPPPPEQPPSPGYTPTPASVPPPPPPRRNATLPVVLGMGGCLVILCLASCAVLAFIILRNRSQMPDIARLVPAEPTLEVLPNDLPLPTQAPLATKAPLPGQLPTPTLVPTATPVSLENNPPSDPGDLPSIAWPADIGQQLTETYFSDDFSSAEYDWWDVSDEINIWRIVDGHYSLHLLRADYTAWAYLPVEFTPNTIGFDAAVQPGFDQGAYGVICYYQDEDNYHFVSVDPVYQEYSIGYVTVDGYETLLENMWMPAKGLKEDPYAINNVLVVCDPDMIILFINNELEAQASAASVTGGVSAIFGETWEDTPASGFKVLFDNLYAFKPAQ